jgi:two-component system, OmpR family, catabolic regulation response regulator CreB
MSGKDIVLIVEDEPGIADALVYSLSTEGFEPVWVATAAEGLTAVREKRASFVVLDIGLPDMSGFDCLKEIRKISDIPVLCLTARSSEIDKVLGLELGADDYVVKPFSPREVCARVKAVLRRTDPKIEHSDSPFIIDQQKRQISYFDEKLSLSRYEYEILLLLITRPGWVFSRQKIMDLVWMEPDDSFERTIDAHIKSIRSKMKAVRDDIDPIETHRGVGYSLREEL